MRNISFGGNVHETQNAEFVACWFGLVGLSFYGPVNPVGLYRALSVYLTTLFPRQA